jgi:hypothetical protein
MGLGIVSKVNFNIKRIRIWDGNQTVASVIFIAAAMNYEKWRTLEIFTLPSSVTAKRMHRKHKSEQFDKKVSFKSTDEVRFFQRS